MKSEMFKNRIALASITSALLSPYLAQVAQAGETCPTNGSGPDICVAFDGAAPTEGFHFTVDYTTDAANPSVKLKTGNLTWNVRSDDDGSAGNIGTISIDPTVSTANFQVSILDGTGPGAVNVKTIALTATSWTGHSSLIDVEISGGMPGTGGLKVVEDASGNGGIVENVVIGGVGGVFGNINIPNLKSLTLKGAGHGDIFIVDILAGGTLEIQNNVIWLRAIQIDMMRSGSTVKMAKSFPSGTAITIDDMETGVTIEIGYAFGTWCMGGGVTLGAGLSSGSSLIIHEVQEAASVINLTGDALAGTIEFKRQIDGSVLAGSVSSTGLIDLRNMNGPITISGDMAGEIHVGLSVQNLLQIDGDLSGDIIIDRDLWTPLNIDGANGVTSTGTITVVRDVTSGGSINVAGDMAGAIDVQIDLIGDLNIVGDADAGTISVTGNVDGDIDIDGDSGDIDIDGGLVSVGRILVDGEAKGGITLGKRICPSALIRVVGGLASTGFIEINPAAPSPSCGMIPFEHGDIEIGNGGNFIFHPSAYILISDGGAPPAGNWTGAIKVIGDFTADPGDELEICVCGTMSGTITILQPSLTPEFDTPTAACNSHCD